MTNTVWQGMIYLGEGLHWYTGWANFSVCVGLQAEIGSMPAYAARRKEKEESGLFAPLLVTTVVEVIDREAVTNWVASCGYPLPSSPDTARAPPETDGMPRPLPDPAA